MNENPLARNPYRCRVRGCPEATPNPGIRCHRCDLQLNGWLAYMTAALHEAEAIVRGGGA